jgi:hypothetical protein
MGDIQIGDEVSDPEGGTAFVVGVFPQGEKDIYRLTFSDGSRTECCDEHLWLVNTPLRKWRNCLPPPAATPGAPSSSARPTWWTSGSGNSRLSGPACVPCTCKRISDVDQFFADQPDNAPLVGVLKQTTARSASGWEHAYDYGGPASHNYGSKGYVDVLNGRGARCLSARKLLDLPAENGRLPNTRSALQQRGVRCPVCGETQFISGRPLAVGELKSATRFCSNERAAPRCTSSPAGAASLRSEAASSCTRSGNASSAAITSRPLPVEPGPPLNPHDHFGYGKVPLAGYIKKRANGRLDLLIVDEVHQYKGVRQRPGLRHAPPGPGGRERWWP